MQFINHQGEPKNIEILGKYNLCYTPKDYTRLVNWMGCKGIENCHIFEKKIIVLLGYWS